MKEFLSCPQNWIERDKFFKSGVVKFYKGCVLGNVSSDFYLKELKRENSTKQSDAGGEREGVMHRKNTKSMTNFFPSKRKNMK